MSIPLGGFGGLTATAPNASSTRASFTIILAPAVATPPPPVEVITFVGQSMANVNATSISTAVLSAVLTGDGLLMFLSENTVATISDPIGVTGWLMLDSKTAGTTATRVWRRVAAGEDAAAAVTLTRSATSKANLTIVAYRGTAPTDRVASFASAASVVVSTVRTTPTTPATAPNWVVSYWMHRDSTSTALVAPVDVVARASGSQTGSGRVSCLVADSG